MDVEMDVGKGREEEIREVHDDSRQLVHNGKYVKYMYMNSSVRLEVRHLHSLHVYASALPLARAPILFELKPILHAVHSSTQMRLTATSCSPSGITMSSSAATKLKSIPTLMFCTAAPKYLPTNTF